MKAGTIDKLVWPAIYGGLIVGSFGFALRDDSAPIAWALIGTGAVLIACGLVLIGMRQRRPDDER